VLGCCKWPGMVENASGEAGSTSRATVTRLSLSTSDARETLHPAANGNSPCLQFLMVSAFLASRETPACSKDGAAAGCRHTGRATAGVSGALSSGVVSEK
jgi:hypothetical protein